MFFQPTKKLPWWKRLYYKLFFRRHFNKIVMPAIKGYKFPELKLSDIVGVQPMTSKIDTKFTMPLVQLTKEQSELIERLRNIATKHRDGQALTDEEQELMRLTTFKTDPSQQRFYDRSNT